MEELLSQHRREAKELQNKITSKKKNATKKTRKGVNDECASLETALKERHAAEVAALSSTTNGEATMASGANGDNITNDAGVVLVDPFASDDTDDNSSPDPDSTTNTNTNTNSSPPNAAAASNLATGLATNLHISSPETNGDDDAPRRKGNRQKARLARRAAEQDALVAAAASEAAAAGPDRRTQERETVDAALAARGLIEVKVRSDGHCMYAAVADQVVGALGLDLTTKVDAGVEAMAPYQVVRAEVADEILTHAEDYAPFMDDQNDLGTGQGIRGYAARVKETAEWGGHLELLACARRWRMVLNVLQGDGRVERIDGTEGGSGDREAWLVYYRHSFGLGEHYNSLRKGGSDV